MKISQKKYTTPKLCTCNGDLSKPWFVYFRYQDGDEKKLFRYKMGLNYFETKKERVQEGNAIIRALSVKLEDGWNPITDCREEGDEDKNIIDTLLEILMLKKAYITERSYKTYADELKLFTKWLKSKKYDHLYTQNITAYHLRQYLDYLLADKQYCGKTYNGHLTMLRTFFNSMVERGYMKVSPVNGIKSVRQDTGKNTTYSTSDERKIDEYMKKHNWNFYLATRFVRYCFLRRSELALVQVKHINWENKTLIIPSKSAKSRVQDSVTIPGTLEKLIELSGLLQMDPEFYIFGYGPRRVFNPGPVRMNRVDNFTDMQRDYNRIVGVGQGCTFYSWKHTGAVELYNLTKDPYVVMRQCRHSDIKMTMIYLRSLGCGVNEHVRAW